MVRLEYVVCTARRVPQILAISKLCQQLLEQYLAFCASRNSGHAALEIANSNNRLLARK